MYLKTRLQLSSSQTFPPLHSSSSAPKLSSRFDPTHQPLSFRKAHQIPPSQLTSLSTKLTLSVTKYVDFMNKVHTNLTQQIRIKQYTHQILQHRATSSFKQQHKTITQFDSNDLLKRREIQKKVIERIKIKQKNKLRRMFKEDLLKIVQKLKKYNVSPGEVYEYNLFSPDPYVFGEEIFRYILQQQYTPVKYLLLQNRLIVYSYNNEMRTPLICAAIRGNLEMVKLLVENGSQMEHKDLLGNTAVMYCSKYGRYDCLKYLIAKGVELEYGGEEEGGKEGKGKKGKRVRAIDVAKDERVRKIVRMAKTVGEMMRALPEGRREFYVAGEYLRLGL